MATYNYPGKGLSPLQLVFALNEELKRVAYSPLLTLEAVSQLDKDASTALATIREWRNSFISINRIPLDVLSLIPTHLTSQKDRFHAASVCRRWRGSFLEYGTLWTQLFLEKGEEYVSTLLDRAKGSALDVITHRDAPADTMALISPHAQQIRYLKFFKNCWQDIITFSEFGSGQLPLLRTLEITYPEIHDLYGQPTMKTPPSNFLFSRSVGLEEFSFNSDGFRFLGLFNFPNLTTFDLWARPTEEVNISTMFDFLKASPLLRTVRIRFATRLRLRYIIPQEELLILPNVETFSLYMQDTTVTRVFEVAARVSCPRARDVALMHDMDDDDMAIGLEIFPNPASWSAIVRQHATGPIEEVKLEIKPYEWLGNKCILTFRSPDTTILRLAFDVETGGHEDEAAMSLEDMGWEAFSQAFTTIRNHPLLSHIKRLHIEYRAAMTDEDSMIRIVGKVGELFGSLRPLEELTISGCDLHIFLPAFLDGADMELLDLVLPIVFPWIKELKILHPVMEDDKMECMNAIVGLAKAQHALGIPFERVMVRMWTLPADMAEELRRWVDVVDCREAWYGEE